MKMLRSIGLGLTLTAVVAGVAEAQVEQGQFQVSPFGGYLLFAESAALDDAVIAGLDAAYYLTPNLAIGITGSYGQSTGDGSFFPRLTFVGEEEVEVHQIDMDVNFATYAATARLGTNLGSLSPYVSGGVGGWLIFLDPEQNNGPGTHGDLMLEVGGGASYAISSRAGLRVDVRDQIFTGYDRDILNPINPRFQTTEGFEDEIAAKPDEQSTIHNFRIALGFTFIPQ